MHPTFSVLSFLHFFPFCSGNRTVNKTTANRLTIRWLLLVTPIRRWSLLALLPNIAKSDHESGNANLSGFVATPHVLGDVLDTLDRLSDLRRHHGKGHHGVDALRAQLTRHLPKIWSPRGLLLMSAGAGAFLGGGVLHGRQLAVPELQTVEGASAHLLETTNRPPSSSST